MLISLLLICLASPPSYGDQDDEQLPQETIDPTAPLPAVTLGADYSPKLWNTAGDATTYDLTVANPYYLWKQANLLHVQIPYDIHSGQGTTLITNMAIFRQPWGRFGFGVDAGVTPPIPGREGIKYGPAFGIVGDFGKCRLGIVNLNYFNSDTSASAAQLIAGCSVGSGWTVSAGSFTWIYNWKAESLLQAPLSVQAGRVVKIAGQPMQFFVNPQYNIRKITGSPRWTISFGITFVASPM